MSKFLEMSDADFANSNPPVVTEDVTKETPTAVVVDESTQTDPVESEQSEKIEDGVKAEDVDSSKSVDEVDPAKVDEVVEQDDKAVAVKPKTEPGKDTVVVETDASKKVDTSLPGSKTDVVVVTPPNYEEFYQKVMAPFKANGKTINLQSPDEALQLMKMGANYTRKMQDLAPHRKILMMLESNSLLDEGKLSYLIDLDKKNPEAIKKLLKDGNIDPLEIDTSSEPAYQEGNHRVTDSEAEFRLAVDELASNQEGKETLREVNERWDHASKEALLKSPEVLHLINQQRESGIYQRIVDNIDRDKTLGKIAPETPFLQAYKTIGDRLAANNGFDDLVKKPAVNTTPVAVRKSIVKPAVVNTEKVNAASPSRSTPKAATTVTNPLSMSDDDFLKQMKNRL